MKIVVCIKQVPNTDKVRIDEKKGTLIREGVPSIINPDDMNALEAALAIKDSHENVHITVITMGIPQAEDALREAMAMGVDAAIHVTDRAFAGSDTWGTATVLAAALRKIGDYDIVICGRQAIDGDTAQVGPELAEFLDIPQITYVKELTIAGNKVKAKRAFEGGYFEMEAPLPVLLTVIKEINKPRFMDIRLIYKAYGPEADFKVWTAKDLDVDLTQIGVENSPTHVFKSFVPVREFKGACVSGAPKDVAAAALEKIISLNLR
jgi:electron transfer flavoprotein beta subunit